VRTTCILRSALALLVALVASGCAAAGPPASPPGSGPTEVRLAYQPGPASLPFEVAMRNGIFERNGLHVVPTEGLDLTVFTTAVSQGRYEIAMTVPTMALAAAEKGLDVEIVASLFRSSPERPNLAWVTKDPAIHSVEQLRGRTVAVPALVGQVTDSFKFLLQQRGVDPKEVKFVAVQAAALDQLQEGRVDAVVHGMVLGRPAVAELGLTAHEDVVAQAVQEASGGTVREALTLAFASSSAYARDHPEVIRAFRKSLNEAVDHMESHDAEARALLQERFGASPEVAASVVWPTWKVEVEPAEVAPYVTISRAVGTITGTPDVDRLVWQDKP
jgi:NitT/TauT family transport system substrate-binding protein